MGLSGSKDDAFLVLGESLEGLDGYLADAFFVEESVVVITDIDPDTGYEGTSVTITGTGFQAEQEGGSVTFGSDEAEIVSWSATEIVCLVPFGSPPLSGALTVTVENDSSASDTIGFYVNETPTSLTITAIDPDEGYAGTVVTIIGTEFGVEQGSGLVKFGIYNADITSWTETLIVCTVPSGPLPGLVTVTVSNFADDSDTISFTMLLAEPEPPPPIEEPPGTKTFSLAFVDWEYVRTDGTSGDVLLEINDGLYYSVMANTFAPRPATQRQTFTDSPLTDGQQFVDGLEKFENIEIPLSIIVYGSTATLKDVRVQALIAELRRDTTLWLTHTPTGGITKYYKCSPPAEIDTDMYWWREFQDSRRAVVNCTLSASEPFGEWVEYVLDADNYVGGEWEAALGLVIPPDDIEGEAPAPCDIYIDSELTSPASPASSPYTDFIIGQRDKYSSDFNPVVEPKIGSDVLDDTRRSGDYSVLETSEEVGAEIWADGFEEFSGSGITANFTHWVEARSGNPNIGMYQSGSSSYEGSSHINFKSTDYIELAPNRSFESWTGTYPHISFTSWAKWENNGEINPASNTAYVQGAYSGSYGVKFQPSFIDGSHYTNLRLTTNSYITVDSGESYYLGAYMRRGTSYALAPLIIEARCYGASGDYLGTVQTYNDKPSMTWTRHGGVIDPGDWPANTTKIKIRFWLSYTGTGNVGSYAFDLCSFYQISRTFAEYVTSEVIAIADDSLVHRVSFYGYRNHPSYTANLNSTVTVNFYDVGNALLDTKVLWSGKPHNHWQLYNTYINPTDFPEDTDYIKLQLYRAGTVNFTDTANGQLSTHHFDAFSITTGYSVECGFNVSDMEGRYLPTAGMSFGGSTSYSEITFDRFLAGPDGTPITSIMRTDVVDIGDANTDFHELALLADRLGSIKISSFKISDNADKSVIQEVHRWTTDALLAQDFWYDHYALIPVDRSFIEVDEWDGSCLIFDSHSGAVLTSLDGTLDTAQVFDPSDVKGTPNFRADPNGMNLAFVAVYDDSGDQQLLPSFSIMLRYRPRYRL